VPSAGLLGAAIVLVVGFWINRDHGQLGVPVPPFLSRWGPQIAPLAAVSVLVLGAAVALAPALVTRIRSRWRFAISAYGLALVLGLSLNLARAGTSGWSKVFAPGPHGSIESRFEYLRALPALDHGVGYYLAHFATLFPQLTTHVKGNPPGPLIALHLLGIDTAGELAALCIALGALTAPLAYDLGCALGDERRGRLAAVLTAFSPSVLLFGVTSLDYVFATLGLAVACLLVRGGRRALVAGSIAAAIASFCSWLLLAIPAWAAVVALRRSGWRRAVAVGLGPAIAVVALNALLALAYGYDPFAALRATGRAYAHGIATIRPYAFWVFGSPAAWMVMLGIPITWLALRALAVGDPAAIATWALVAVAALIGLTKGETERIWLPFAPLACVAAAGVLSGSRLASGGRLRLLLAALAAQALAVELLFFTIW
jgi:hypothetical protein